MFLRLNIVSNIFRFRLSQKLSDVLYTNNKAFHEKKKCGKLYIYIYTSQYKNYGYILPNKSFFASNIFCDMLSITPKKNEKLLKIIFLMNL